MKTMTGTMASARRPSMSGRYFTPKRESGASEVLDSFTGILRGVVLHARRYSSVFNEASESGFANYATRPHATS